MQQAAVSCCGLYSTLDVFQHMLHAHVIVAHVRGFDEHLPLIQGCMHVPLQCVCVCSLSPVFAPQGKKLISKQLPFLFEFFQATACKQGVVQMDDAVYPLVNYMTTSKFIRPEAAGRSTHDANQSSDAVCQYVVLHSQHKECNKQAWRLSQ